MILCKTLNKSFETQKELFGELKANESRIIAFKKAQNYKSAWKGQTSGIEAFLKKEIADKAGLTMKQGFIYPVINTTRYMDDQDDVHFDGIWKKSLSEQSGKIFYLSAHSKKIEDVIAWPEDVRAFTSLIDWQYVGKEYEGQTEALIFEISESKIKKDCAIDAIRERRKVQGSVSMIYVKIMLGVNSTEVEFKANKSYYDSKINLIANKDAVEKQGYFFGVEEAKINKEGSLVLQGSNDATEIIYPDDDESPESTQQHIIEPEDKSTQKAIDYEFLIKNLKNK